MTISLLTSDQIAERTKRVVAAAMQCGKNLGLDVSDAEVLYDAFSVVVRLAPAPVVARVQVVLPIGLDLGAQLTRQKRELAVVRWLQAKGIPVARPSGLVPCEPVHCNGFSMTFWEPLSVDRTAVPDFVADAHYAAELHAALTDCDVELPFLAPLAHTVPSCLDYLARNPSLVAAADLERARAEWDHLAPHVSSREAFERVFPGITTQVIHGDGPVYNMIRTHDGPVFADFEDTTWGPAEWDMVGFDADAIARYDAKAATLGLRPLDKDVLRLMETARALQAVGSLALTPQLPQLAEWLDSWLQKWRESPFVGGLTLPKRP
ncbi:MAG: phosphotransferase [Polyangiaceae bacterium]|nr:phosphotransferase [Polyangiaceae bacterium]